MKTIRNRAIITAALLFAAVFSTRADNDDAVGGANIGERLFLETRFAQFFFTNSGGDANFQLTNGTANWTYYVLASTNLLAPIADWTVIATNTFDSSVQLSFTNAINPDVSQQNYTLLPGSISPAVALPGTIALFKTPTVRDLVSSEPHLHTGQLDTIEDVVQFYLNTSTEARAGAIRNADRQLGNISLDTSAVAPLAAFLRALDEENYATSPALANERERGRQPFKQH